MLRRLHHEQPEGFAFTPANLEWARGQIAKYPEGRQASAVIALLWRAQEQEGWISRPAIEAVAEMLDMPQIRVLEVATFYTMFKLKPVGSVAHIEVCGTTPCMLCGSEDLLAVCRERIAPRPLEPSADGKFSWEEVECLGACANAPMVQIGKDYYEDLDRESFAALLDAFARGEPPRPGSQKGRWASEPASGATSLKGEREHGANAAVDLALQLEDGTKRIDGSERTASDLMRAVPRPANRASPPPGPPPRKEPEPIQPDAMETERRSEEAKAWPPVGEPARKAEENGAAQPEDRPAKAVADLAGAAGNPTDEEMARHAAIEPTDDDKPDLLAAPRAGAADDLQRIKGIGPKLEEQLNALGVHHLDQIANWSEREVAWVDRHLEGFNGRILRDAWVAQAKALTSKGET